MSRESGDFNEDRAELFEALGHPTRITVLQILSKSSLGFSDLKREAGIDSNGLLSFHLGKLENLDLVRTSDGGNYQLTDEGREALRIVTTNVVDRPTTRNSRLSIKPLQVIVLALVVALAFTAYFGYTLQNSNQQQALTLNSLNQSNHILDKDYLNLTQQYNISMEKFYSGGVASELSNNSAFEAAAAGMGAKYFSLNTDISLGFLVPSSPVYGNETINASTIVSGYIWSANGTFILAYSASVDPVTLQVTAVSIYQLDYVNFGGPYVGPPVGPSNITIDSYNSNITEVPTTIPWPTMSDYVVYVIQGT